MGKAKVTVAGISIILVVGVVPALPTKVGGASGDGNGDDDLSFSSKAVAAICRPTDYKKLCVESLGEAANNETASPKDLFKAVLNSTIQRVLVAVDKSSVLSQNTTSPHIKCPLRIARTCWISRWMNSKPRFQRGRF
ncbi:hypothetical protein F8388_014975 [Cannabis sativa]|uniref:Pectinesterase inhibitor domain-containing protein n=1 Tax=Cannabis sativa TaxID=3483 RepID=A0A7J6DWN5_CANSA|nr:hypothetical protein F8388_014975 [Cannabis sativa]